MIIVNIRTNIDCQTLDSEYLFNKSYIYWRVQHLKYILLIVRIFFSLKSFIFTINWLHSLEVCFKVYCSSTDIMLFSFLLASIVRH